MPAAFISFISSSIKLSTFIIPRYLAEFTSSIFIPSISISLFFTLVCTILEPYFDHIQGFSRNIVGNLGEGCLGYTGNPYVICLYSLILTIFKYTFKLQGLYKVKFYATMMMMIMKRVYLQYTRRKTGFYERPESQLLEIWQKYELAGFQRQIWSVTTVTACSIRFSYVKE